MKLLKRVGKSIFNWFVFITSPVWVLPLLAGLTIKEILDGDYYKERQLDWMTGKTFFLNS